MGNEKQIDYTCRLDLDFGFFSFWVGGGGYVWLFGFWGIFTHTVFITAGVTFYSHTHHVRKLPFQFSISHFLSGVKG